ncbi:MAG: glycosyltransferase [Candidatus Enteromonas sp.]
MRRGGIEAFVMSLIRYHADDRVAYSVCQVTDGKGLFDDELKLRGVPVHYIDKKKGSFRRFEKDLKTLLTTEKIDIVHIHGDAFCASIYLALKRLSFPNVVAHSHNNASPISDRWLTMKKWVAANWSVERLACSESAGEYLFRKKPFTVIKNGIPLADFAFIQEKRERIRAKLSIPFDAKVLGSVGRLDISQKNQDFLLNLLVEGGEKLADWHLILVGDGKDVDLLEKSVEEKGLTPRVHFVHGENASDYYSSFDVFALPSHYEGMGIVVAEAIANGLDALVSTNVPPCPGFESKEVFLPIDTPNSYAAWAEQIIHSVQNRNQGNATLVQSAGYDIRDTVQRLEQIYKRIFFSKKTMGIITQCDLSNYGNRLQNFALMASLSETFSLKVENIWPSDIVRKRSVLFYPIHKVLNFSRRIATSPFPLWQRRYSRFSKFAAIFPKNHSLLLPFSGWKKINRHFDYLLAGSDQVVNAEFGIPDSIVSFEKSTRPHCGYFAISAGSEMPSKNNFPQFLAQVADNPYVSVREEELAQHLCPMTKEDPRIHIDPSFLLTPKAWAERCEPYLSEKAKRILKSKYLLVYWLGKQTKEEKDTVNQIAESKGLDLVYLRTNSTDTDSTFIDAGPADFVLLFQHATFVVSKSFHGCAFATLFNVPFVGYDAHWKQTGVHDYRLSNLSRQTGLSNEFFEFPKIPNTPPDWSFVNRRIEEERGESLTYLESFLFQDIQS